MNSDWIILIGLILSAIGPFMLWWGTTQKDKLSAIDKHQMNMLNDEVKKISIKMDAITNANSLSDEKYKELLYKVIEIKNELNTLKNDCESIGEQLSLFNKAKGKSEPNP